MAVSDDQIYMAQAIKLARLGWYTTSPNPRVGCVIVRAGTVLSQGAHLQAGEGHAEANALASCKESVRGATAYVTLEPCSHHGRTGPCAQALVDAQIKRVVIGMIDPNPLVSGNGIAILQAAGIEVVCGVLEAECQALNPGFIQRMQVGLPRVRVKMAASLDGRTALANGQSQWITGSAARADVQRYRAESCMILSTAETVIQDQARLNVRLEQLPITAEEYGPKSLRQPLRVILDGRGRLTGDEAIFASPEQLLLVRPINSKTVLHTQIAILEIAYDANGFVLPELLQALAKRGCNELWVEAGATLAGAMLEANLVDQLIVYLAPKLMGQDARELLRLPLQSQMDALPRFAFEQATLVGEDVRLIAKVK